MTKEEIVSNIKWALRGGCKRACSPSDHDDDTCKCDRDILSILNQYASQVSVGFADWMRKGYIDTTQGWLPRENWCDPDKNGYYAKPNSKFYTTHDLFTQYLKTIEQ